MLTSAATQASSKKVSHKRKGKEIASNEESNLRNLQWETSLASYFYYLQSPCIVFFYITLIQLSWHRISCIYYICLATEVFPCFSYRHVKVQDCPPPPKDVIEMPPPTLGLQETPTKVVDLKELELSKSKQTLRARARRSTRPRSTSLERIVHSLLLLLQML